MRYTARQQNRDMDNKLYDALKKVFDLTDGPWDDPVISEELYYEIESALKEYKSKEQLKPNDSVKLPDSGSQ